MSQVITIELRSGQWHVDGSSTGADMATWIGNEIGGSVPAVNPHFTLNFFQGGSPQEGDRVSFAVIASGKDGGVQKRLLFADTNGAFNAGKSRLRVAPGAGLELRGAAGYPTLVDRLSGTATYYTLVASGSFTAERSSITNMDSAGLQLALHSGQTVALATTTFDSMGVAAATGAYITLTSQVALAPAATFYGLTFGTTRTTAPAAAAYNMRATGVGIFPAWTLRQWSGALGGEKFDDEPFDVFKWAPFRPGEPAVSTFTAITTHSVTSVWTQGANDAGLVYEVQANTYPFANEGLHATFTYTGFTAPVDGLSANTSYYLRVFAGLQFGPDQWDLEFSPELNFPATATLAVTPSTHSVPFLFVTSTSATLGWHRLPLSPLSASASGYILEASTTNFDGTGAVISSVTYSVLESTLTVGGPGGLLLNNSTYFFRVGSLNPFGQPNYIALGATSTLSNSVATSGFSPVSRTSATFQWTPRPPSPPSAREDSGEGYLLQASTAADFGGVIFASATPNVSADRLTVGGLLMGATYYFRVGALNWNGVPNFGLGVAQSTMTEGWHVAYQYSLTDQGTGVSWGDHNNDGRLDLALATNGQFTKVFGNTGDLAFVTSDVGASEPRYKPLWCDTDLDGDLDLYLAKRDAGTAGDKLFRNEGGAVFVQVYENPVAGLSRGAVCADFDGDGYPDIARAVESGPAGVFWNRGGNTFTGVWNTGNLDDFTDVAALDFDGDADADLVFSGPSAGKVYRNDGNFGFQLQQTLSAGSYGVAAADFDGDGDPDLALGGRAQTSPVRLLRNDGGTFNAAWQSALELSGDGHISVADFDGDGRRDLLVGSRSGEPTRVFRATAPFGFEVVFETRTSDTQGFGAAWGRAAASASSGRCSPRRTRRRPPPAGCACSFNTPPPGPRWWPPGRPPTTTVPDRRPR
ncbi:MAG: hypothetical protein FD126_1512 [Elusimicrobia bacterium]|nr:MAG: hypothetical protein FD126_1512 [Elusimicrobiota bacterium]